MKLQALSGWIHLRNHAADDVKYLDYDDSRQQACVEMDTGTIIKLHWGSDSLESPYTGARIEGSGERWFRLCGWRGGKGYPRLMSVSCPPVWQRNVRVFCCMEA